MESSSAEPRSHRLDFRQLLEARAQMIQAQSKSRAIAKRGEPMFTRKDMMETLNPIARIFRMICIKTNVSEDELFEKHREYFGSLGVPPMQINTDKHNLRKALAKPCMTVSVIEKLLTILGYRVLDISFKVVKTDTGEVSEYSYSGAEEFKELGPSCRRTDGSIDPEE